MLHVKIFDCQVFMSFTNRCMLYILLFSNLSPTFATWFLHNTNTHKISFWYWLSQHNFIAHVICVMHLLSSNEMHFQKLSASYWSLPGFNKDLVDPYVLGLWHGIHYSIGDVLWIQYFTTTTTIICFFCLKRYILVIVNSTMYWKP